MGGRINAETCCQTAKIPFITASFLKKQARQVLKSAWLYPGGPEGPEKNFVYFIIKHHAIN
jgi:hypothetical protein